MNGVSKRSERSEVECCGASERSERCERTNIASDRVACSKRGCLTRNAPKEKGFTFKKKTKVMSLHHASITYDHDVCTSARTVRVTLLIDSIHDLQDRGPADIFNIGLDSFINV